MKKLITATTNSFIGRRSLLVRVLSIVLAVLICTLLLSGCNKTTDNLQDNTTHKWCDHKWSRDENLNQYTAVEKCSKCGVTRKYTDPDNIPNIDFDTDFEIMCTQWGGYISSKTIPACDLGCAIIDCLTKLQETGAVVPKISDDTFNGYRTDTQVDVGTMWIDCQSIGLFRISPKNNEICKVQTHYGEGKALQMTDTLDELLHQAWCYYPNDYWSGSYKDGKESLRQVYKADSAVEWVAIESISIKNERRNNSNPKNCKIKLCIGAKESKTVNACIQSYQSSDNLGSIETKSIELIKGKETTVELAFYGFYNWNYHVTITVDNTKIDLAIDPTNTTQSNS